jgi:hypothetical protein
MKVATVLMLLVGVFGLLMLVLGLFSLTRDGNLPLFGRMFGGWFLIIVSLFIAGGGFTLFFRMRR